MDIVTVRPDLRMLISAPGRAYLLRRGNNVLLVDTGRVRDDAAIATALHDWNREGAALTHVVLTHWHADHTGAAAAISHWPGVRILAHRHDAPVIRGERPGEAPAFTEAETALHAQVASDLPDAPPARVDRELDDGAVLAEFDAHVIATPGHTPGSCALHLPDAGVLFTGDIAAEYAGNVILGPSNTDRELARHSFRRLSGLDLDVVCFGHGEPLTGDATTALHESAVANTIPDPFANDNFRACQRNLPWLLI